MAADIGLEMESEVDVFNLKIRSIIMGVGPNNCGKTTFFKETLIPQLSLELEGNGIEPNIKYLSSDETRRYLYGDTKKQLKKGDSRMKKGSESVYKIIKCQLVEFMKYEYHTHFIILDTTGVNKELQQEILQLATESRYNLYFTVFDFKDRSEYVRCGTPAKNLQMFKQSIGGIPVNHNISHKLNIRKRYTNKNAIFSIEDLKKYIASFLNPEKQYLVMMNLDYKVCIDTILKAGFKIEEYRIIPPTPESKAESKEKIKEIDIILYVSEKDKSSEYDKLTSKNTDLIVTLEGKKTLEYMPKKSDNWSKIFMVKNEEKPVAYIAGYGIRKPKDLIEVKIKKEKPETETTLFENLDEEKKERIRNIIKHKINFISGTVCPANKTATTLEDPLMALKYYRDLGKSSTVSVMYSCQVKYMGSRLQYYYFYNQPEKCYGTTRNGYVTCISHGHIRKIYDKLTLKLGPWFEKNNVEFALIDGELLPWSLLGQGLINHEFKSVCTAAEKELDILEESGFTALQDELLSSYKKSEYKGDQNTMSGEKLSKKYPNYQSFKTLSAHHKRYSDLSDQRKGVETFKAQMELFGKETEVDFKPWSLLKLITKDKKEYIPGILTHGTIEKEITEIDKIEGFQHLNQINMFQLLCDDPKDQIIISLEDPSADDLLMKFFKHTVDDRLLEGIVIKPSYINPDHAPYIKARGPAYLHIIYGPDYLQPVKYKKLLDNKNIKQKLQVSIAESRSGIDMLLTRMDAISMDNKQYIKHMIDYLFLEESEKEIDYAL